MGFPGIAIPDLIVQRLAQATVRALLDENSVVRGLAEQIVRTLPAADRDTFLTTLRNQPGRAVLAFGLGEKEDWQVVVMMTDAHDAIRTTGDDVGVDEEELGIATLDADLSALDGAPLPLVDVPEGLPARGRVRLGEELAIYTREGDAFTLAYRGIGGTPALEHAEGADVVFHELSSRIGWDEYCTVRVDVLSRDAFFNAVLCTVIKAALLAARDTLEAQGLTLKRARESGPLQPRPIAWPAHLLNRTLTLEVHRRFAVPETLAVVTGLESLLTAEIGPRHDDPGFP